LGFLCFATASHSQDAPTPPQGKTHTYYIAADEVVWDYAPSGRNQIAGRPFGTEESFWIERGPHRVGKVYKKALYREYTDSTFTTRKPRPPEWEHLGFLGPLLRAEVGDTIRVVFKNNTGFPASLHPHGVIYNKDSEGAPYNDSTRGTDKADDGVAPGGVHTYVWPVPERAGPASGDRSSILWMYHSHTNEVKDVNSGLVGPIIVSALGATKADGTPQDVDREFVVAFAEVDEYASWYLKENIQTYMSDPNGVTIGPDPFGATAVTAKDEPPKYDFKDTMNGFLYGNTPVMTMQVGERVRWYVMATTNFELHAPHWHGNTVEIHGMRTDVAPLLTMGMFVADMIPDNPGTWLFHCHVSNHLEAGMLALYSVRQQ
jgi:FtsP/CotA-like multicopper oxidase with cupredoxin domain